MKFLSRLSIYIILNILRFFKFLFMLFFTSISLFGFLRYTFLTNCNPSFELGRSHLLGELVLEFIFTPFSTLCIYYILFLENFQVFFFCYWSNRNSLNAQPFIPNEVFYQLNYCWIWCVLRDLNSRPIAYGGEGKIRTCIRVFFQLNYFPKGYCSPTELKTRMAGTVGNRTHPSGFGDRLASLGTFAPILTGVD